jgi:hypothetical protein
MKKSAHIAAAIVLAAGFVYFVTVQKDDKQMIEFKAKTAAFVRGGKPSAPLRDVLGRGGDRICVKYDDSGDMEITIQDYKVLTVMKGRRDVIVDGKSYAFKVNSDCVKFGTATIGKQDGLLLIGGRSAADAKQVTDSKPKAKKKPAPPPVKKKPAPARNYGY